MLSFTLDYYFDIYILNFIQNLNEIFKNKAKSEQRAHLPGAPADTWKEEDEGIQVDRDGDED